jgi:hypothetical protein
MNVCVTKSRGGLDTPAPAVPSFVEEWRTVENKEDNYYTIEIR